MRFTKEEIDEVNDALDDSLKYYKDILDDPPLDPEKKKMSIQYARARIKIIESIKMKLDQLYVKIQSNSEDNRAF